MMRPKSIDEGPMPGFPHLLYAQSAADLLGVSAATLNRWAALRDQGADVGPPCYALSERVRRWDSCGMCWRTPATTAGSTAILKLECQRVGFRCGSAIV